MPPNSQLSDLDEQGKPVQSRIEDAEQALEIVIRLLNSNRIRMERAVRVMGMIDGNSTESRAKLRRDGRGNEANINWREAKGHIQNAWTPYYDLSIEVPVCIEADLDFAGPDIDSELVSGFATEFHKLVTRWRGFDRNEQMRDWQMLQHGVGTMIFENEWDWRPVSVLYPNVFVDDETDCDLENSEIVMVTHERSAGWLWGKINGSEKQAASAGWNVDAVKRAIMSSASSSRTSMWQWNKWQQAFTNGDIYVSVKLTKKIQVATLFVREMDGTISQHLVQYPRPNKAEYLFSQTSVYKDWSECVLTFPYDVGTDGTYHSIKGLGTEIYSYCDLSNRIKNQLANMVLTSIQPMFQAKTGKDAQAFQMMRMGGYNVVPPGLELLQSNLGGALSPALEISRDMQSTLGRNTGTYQQDISEPTVAETAKSVQIRAMDRGKLSKGAHNRFLRSKDKEMSEMWRRATNPKIKPYHPGGKEALEFQAECHEICDRYGVPHTALQEVENVRAYRSFGLGNAALRMEISDALMQIYPELDPIGKNKVLRARVASYLGYSSVDSIVPSLTQGDIPTEDDSIATLENNGLNSGDPKAAVITPRQDHGIHLKYHVGSMGEDMQACQQGQQDPQQCLVRLEAKGMHSHQHLQLLQSNPMRKQEFDQYSQQLDELANFQNQLLQHIQEMQQNQPQQPGEQSPELVKVQGMIQLKSQKQAADLQLKQAKFQADHALKQQAQQATFALKARELQTKSALSDATTAADIRRKSAAAAHSMSLEQQQAQQPATT